MLRCCVLMLIGCAGGTQQGPGDATGKPTGPTGNTGTMVANNGRVLTSFTADTQALSAPGGGVVTVKARVLDQNGVGMAGIGVLFEVTAGGGDVTTDVVTTTSNGDASAEWTLGKSAVSQTLSATLTGRQSVAPVTFAATVGTEFSIAVQYLSAIEATEQAAIDRAVARWAAVITNDLADTTIDRQPLSTACGGTATSTMLAVDDLALFVTVKAIDGANGLVAAANVCTARPDGSPVVASLALDQADLAALRSKGLLDAVVLHEIGHGLGLGSRWAAEGLLTSPSLPSSPGVDTRFVGPLAAAAFHAAGGSGNVPVDNTAVQAVADAHWRESVLKNELMSASINEIEASYPLSAISIGALADFGFYTVNPLAADPFVVTP